MKKWLTPLIASLIILAGIGLYNHQKNENTSARPSPSATLSPSPTQATTVTYQGADDKTALELLKTTHSVGVEQSSFGEFVTTIDNLKSTDKIFWIFYVDGKQASEGAGTYKTKNGETIEWRYEESKF